MKWYRVQKRGKKYYVQAKNGFFGGWHDEILSEFTWEENAIKQAKLLASPPPPTKQEKEEIVWSQLSDEAAGFVRDFIISIIVMITIAAIIYSYQGV